MPISSMGTVPASDDEVILSHFLRLALAAGQAVMEVFRSECAAASKADLTPVTEADRRSEAIILAGLRSAYPGLACVAEEECAEGIVPAALGREFFLVDPLDGTREFVARRTDFTVNIALIRDAAPVVGVVLAPCSGRIYAGRPGWAGSAAVGPDGALGEFEPIAVRQAGEPFTIVATRSHPTPETGTYVARFHAARLTSIGSSLKFCLVAAGEADLYPRFGRTMEWDTAAGDAVLRAAGGMTTMLDGKPLAYGKRNQPGEADFANPFFIARGDVAEEVALQS